MSVEIEIRFPWFFRKRKSTCERKVRYGHLKTAQDAAKAMKARGILGLSAYPCPHCQGFHIGHEV